MLMGCPVTLYRGMKWVDSAQLLDHRTLVPVVDDPAGRPSTWYAQEKKFFLKKNCY